MEIQALVDLDNATDEIKAKIAKKLVCHNQLYAVPPNLLPAQTDTSPTVAEVAELSRGMQTCICALNKIYWGAYVSCAFRKKVLKISEELWGSDSKIEKANMLMAAMAHETMGTFSPRIGSFKNHMDEDKEGYVGLIQIGKDAAKDLKITRTELYHMTAVEQLDYVKKYIARKKNKFNTLTDMYLAILMPVDCGKGNEPNHVVFDGKLEYNKNSQGNIVKDLTYWRKKGYAKNKAFHKESPDAEKKHKKTYVWEISENLEIWNTNGNLYKTQITSCIDLFITNTKRFEESTSNVVIKEVLTGKLCAHDSVAKRRESCRRGSIAIYDHNKNMVLFIPDCLLEGAGGIDRMVTNSDTPFGTYKIDEKNTFNKSYSAKEKKKYGPNPRLVFEPIDGLGDEADLSDRNNIRIHGGRQRTNPNMLIRTYGCIRITDFNANKIYQWWLHFKKNNPNIKPGCVYIEK